MRRDILREKSNIIEQFITDWRRLAELISDVITKKNVSADMEYEFITLSGALAKNAAILAPVYSLPDSLSQKIMDFLEDIYTLHLLLNMREFQINLLREKWNSIQLEINIVAAKTKK